MPWSGYYAGAARERGYHLVILVLDRTGAAEGPMSSNLMVDTSVGNR